VTEIVIHHSHMVLDACCIINLVATEEFDNILEIIPAQLAITSYVLKYEVITYTNSAGEKVPVDLMLRIQSGQILEVDIDTLQEEEANLLANFASQRLDPCESASAAIAIHRNWGLATDDKRAIYLITQTSPTTQIITTPELLKLWSDTLTIPDKQIEQVIGRIRRYVPPETHPLFQWWKKYSSK
jgi:hypothetical protein